MRLLNKFILLQAACFLGSMSIFTHKAQAQNVGIGTQTPHTSAKLHVEDANRGFLMPRVALVDIANATTPVSSPLTGLLVWNTNASVVNGAGVGFYYWTGVIWEKLVTGNTTSSSDAWFTTGNTGTVNGTNFLGTLDNQSLDIRTNNIIKTRITTKGQIEVLNTGESIFIGEGAGAADDLGNNRNIFIGQDAGGGNITGSRNVGVGYTVLENNTIGTQNVAIGYESMKANTTGKFNTALGPSTLELNQTGDQNVAIGLSALQENQSGNLNIAIGSIALNKNTSGGTNVAIGFSAMTANTTGYNNVAMGSNALADNIDGYENVAIGAGALDENTSGVSNTGIGAAALGNNISGDRNLALGHTSMASNTIGDNNIGIGYRSLFDNTSGSSNTAVGRQAMFGNINGDDNTALGYNALRDNTSGIENTAVGHSAYDNGTFSNSTAIGHNAAITASNQVRLGDNRVTSIGGHANWTNVSDRRFKINVRENVAGLDFINSLRPVTYNLDMDAIARYLEMSSDKRDPIQEANKQAIVQTGFIAQEVETSARALGYDFSGVDAPKDNKDYYGLRYAEFTVPLVKAVQELSEENKVLKERVKALEDNMKKITALLEQK